MESLHARRLHYAIEPFSAKLLGECSTFEVKVAS